jgi:hypothetical protein
MLYVKTMNQLFHHASALHWQELQLLCLEQGLHVLYCKLIDIICLISVFYGLSMPKKHFMYSINFSVALGNDWFHLHAFGFHSF